MSVPAHHALGVAIPSELLDSWRSWFAPQQQPFLLPPGEGELSWLAGPTPDITGEVRDTFDVYDVRARAWLTESDFLALSSSIRRRLTSQRHGQIWRPESLARAGDGPLNEFVGDRLAPSVHARVTAADWREVEMVLPGARDLAGTFAGGSGPNCFGTVMAAAGVDGVSDEWIFQDVFEPWLAGAARPLTRSENRGAAGTVMVWRDAGGLAQHAAVGLSGGLALSKPSQAWFVPRVVWSLAETVRRSRMPGMRLQRYRLAVAPVYSGT